MNFVILKANKPNPKPKANQVHPPALPNQHGPTWIDADQPYPNVAHPDQPPIYPVLREKPVAPVAPPPTPPPRVVNLNIEKVHLAKNKSTGLKFQIIFHLFISDLKIYRNCFCLFLSF